MIVELEPIRRLPKLGERYLDNEYKGRAVIITTAKQREVEFHTQYNLEVFIVVREYSSAEEATKEVRRRFEQEEQKRKEAAEQAKRENYTDGIVYPYQWMDEPEEGTSK